MALKKEPIQIVEIDIDFCNLVFSVGACTAALSSSTTFKCYNSWNTCPVKDVYDKGELTLRFITPRSNIPKSGTYFPVLKSVSAFSSSVNIAGANPKLGTLGKRGKVSVSIDDFAYHDRYTDKYARQRVTGTAQFDGVPIIPQDRGTFFSNFKVRHPNYAGRPMRVINTYVDESGALETDPAFIQTRNFVVTELKGPDTNGRVSIEGKDILTLAEKKSAVAPRPSKGSLAADISAVDTTFTIEPAGIGAAEYPTSGFGVIGSEVVQFTRSADVITLVDRGAKRTEATGHSLGDTFQLAVNYTDASLDFVLDDLLDNYTEISPTFIPTADYATEVAKWGPTIKINTIITEPTPVAELIGELSVLGASVWWDDVSSEVRLRLNHPLDITETSTAINEDNSIKAISEEDRDEERITQVHYYSVQTDPTGSVDDKSNYDRVLVTVDADAQNVNNYGDTRVREIFCRWLNTGNDAIVRNSSSRLLQRFTRAPQYYTITLDAKDISLGLTDILDVTSRVITDVTGGVVAKKLQINSKTEEQAGHEVRVTCQAYDFDEFYGFIMENDANGYDTATDLELEEGCYIIAEADDAFPDGREAYRII